MWVKYEDLKDIRCRKFARLLWSLTEGFETVGVKSSKYEIENFRGIESIGIALRPRIRSRNALDVRFKQQPYLNVLPFYQQCEYAQAHLVQPQIVWTKRRTIGNAG